MLRDDLKMSGHGRYYTRRGVDRDIHGSRIILEIEYTIRTIMV